MTATMSLVVGGSRHAEKNPAKSVDPIEDAEGLKALKIFLKGLLQDFTTFIVFKVNAFWQASGVVMIVAVMMLEVALRVERGHAA